MLIFCLASRRCVWRLRAKELQEDVRTGDTSKDGDDAEANCSCACMNSDVKTFQTNMSI
jgi:hypothetical protein